MLGGSVRRAGHDRSADRYVGRGSPHDDDFAAPVTREAADAESDRLKSCMVRTGKTEAQCRAADGSDRLPSAAGDPSEDLWACMEQTGMSATGRRAASAREEGG